VSDEDMMVELKVLGSEDAAEEIVGLRGETPVFERELDGKLSVLGRLEEIAELLGDTDSFPLEENPATEFIDEKLDNESWVEELLVP
jgi:hypothetical protein